MSPHVCFLALFVKELLLVCERSRETPASGASPTTTLNNDMAIASAECCDDMQM